MVLFVAVEAGGGDAERGDEVAEVGEGHAAVSAGDGQAVAQAVGGIHDDGGGGGHRGEDGKRGARLPGVGEGEGEQGGGEGQREYGGKARREAAGTVVFPAQERADAEEDEACERERHDEAVVVGCADGDFAEVEAVGGERVEGAGEDDEAGAGHQPVVGEDAGFAREQGVGGAAGKCGGALDEEDEGGQGDGDEQGEDVDAARRVGGEGVHRGEDAGADEEGADEAEAEGEDGEQCRPGEEGAAFFADDEAVQQRGADEPRHKRGVFDWVPEPPATPAEFVVRPVAAEGDAEGQRQPGGERPRAGAAQP